MTTSHPRSRERRAAVLAAVLLVAGPAGPAAAQGRSGFWVGGGVGVGSAEVAIDDIELDRSGVAVLHLDGGWTLSPQVLIGVRVDSLGLRLTDSATGLISQKAAVVDLLGTLTFYPKADSGWFVRVGVGGTFIEDLDDEGPLDVHGRGLSMMAGLGYDIPLGRYFAVTPAVSYRFGRVDDLSLSGRFFSSEEWRHDVLAATVSLTFK
jgi:hypothetical protein